MIIGLDMKVKNKEAKRRSAARLERFFNADPGGLRGIIRKLTGRARLEREIMQQKAESAAALGAGLAHDYSNMLAPLTCNLEFTKSLLASNAADAAAPLKTSMELVARMGALAEMFRELSGSRVGEKEPVGLDTVMRAVYDRLKLAKKENISLNFSVGKGCAFLGDPARAAKMLEIFADNAMEAMAESGGTLAMKARKKGKSIAIGISDTGKGIDGENIYKVFDPYFSTKDRNGDKGMGLSLAIAHTYIAMFGGDVGVRSKPGKGTAFIITLPAAEGDRNI